MTKLSRTTWYANARIPRSLVAALAFPIAFFALGCDASKDSTSSTVDDETKKKVEIKLLVTVDWEGRDLTDENLAAMKAFRTKFPSIPIVHFLNAAYFTKPDANAATVESKIKSVLRDGDEIGLHIHGWKRLFEASGVTFRSTPTFWGNGPLSNDCAFDCGHEVPISAYTTAELRKVIRFSVSTLKAHDFDAPVSFRAGGWVAEPHVRDALIAEGFQTENSEVPVNFLKAKLGTMPLYTWLSDLWVEASNVAQPHSLSSDEGRIVEIPDNGALSDYMSEDQMLDVYRANRQLNDKKTPHVVSIGFHQETAAKYLPVLTNAITRIEADAAKDGTNLTTTTSIALAANVGDAGAK